jgi:hypothetical protein
MVGTLFVLLLSPSREAVSTDISIAVFTASIFEEGQIDLRNDVFLHSREALFDKSIRPVLDLSCFTRQSRIDIRNKHFERSG